MGNSELKHCKCYPYLKTGMTIQVDKFNPLICSKCKGVIDYAERSQFLPLDEETVQKEMGEMKLSEILGWENPKCHCGLTYCECIINNYTSCDRETDREALADKIMEINFESYGFSHEEVAYKTADKIIATMPTWLKPTERK